MFPQMQKKDVEQQKSFLSELENLAGKRLSL